jgi:preprotein translocase subunit YajC
MLIENAWAQAASTGADAQAGLPAMIFSYAPLILIVVVFYVLVIRPQSQAAKAQAEMLKRLAKGDVVETSGGVIGVVTRVDDKFVRVRAGDSDLVLARRAVERKLAADEAKLAGVK